MRTESRRGDALLPQPGRTVLTPTDQASYHKGLVLLATAADRLSTVKTAGWTQAHALNDVYVTLQQSLETLADIAPNILSRQLRQQLHHQDF